MYPKPSEFLEQYRIKTGRFRSNPAWGNNGVFLLPGPERHKLYVIASDEMGWEHCSVSLAAKARIPLWSEMVYVKDLFWQEDEVVVQYHPAKADYINFQGSTLHLWKPIGSELPRPPHWMVGPKTVEEGLELMAEVTGRKPITRK
jgi:hypothetical protein